MARDRRWDFLYDRQKQPVKAYLVERFADELAAELREGAHPDPTLRLALELAGLDLARDWDALEARLDGAAPAEPLRSAARTLGRELTERCLELKERAEAARLDRTDLADALRRVERRLFSVTLG